MADASNMIKTIKHTALLVLMTLMFVAGFIVAAPQKAEAGWDLELEFGWDCMILSEDHHFSTTNNGFVGSFMFGYRFFDLVGIYLEQELGFIQPELADDTFVDGVKLEYPRMFKGATLADAQLFFRFWFLETSIKVGVGTMYMHDKPMKKPAEGMVEALIIKDEWEKWFAFRAGLGLAVVLGFFRIGAGFDYTLGAADKNEWDKEDVTHFISVRGFVGFEF